MTPRFEKMLNFTQGKKNVTEYTVVYDSSTIKLAKVQSSSVLLVSY